MRRLPVRLGFLCTAFPTARQDRSLSGHGRPFLSVNLSVPRCALDTSSACGAAFNKLPSQRIKASQQRQTLSADSNNTALQAADGVEISHSSINLRRVYPLLPSVWWFAVWIWHLTLPASTTARNPNTLGNTALQTSTTLTATQRADERRRSAQHGGVRSIGWLGFIL